MKTLKDFDITDYLTDEEYLNEAREHIQKARQRNRTNRIDISLSLKDKADHQ